MPITQVNQVWSTDITYIRLHSGFIYLLNFCNLPQHGAIKFGQEQP
jgi:hypothetical protein